MAPNLARHECVLHCPANTDYWTGIERSIRGHRPSRGNSGEDCLRAQTKHTVMVSLELTVSPRTCSHSFPGLTASRAAGSRTCCVAITAGEHRAILPLQRQNGAWFMRQRRDEEFYTDDGASDERQPTRLTCHMSVSPTCRARDMAAAAGMFMRGRTP